MKRIYIIGTVGVPACYGGFETLVENLLMYAPKDVEYTVFCSAKAYTQKIETYKGAKLLYLNRNANGKDSILYDYESMRIAMRDNADIMLVLGVSGCMFLPFVRRKFKGKIITNIDGLEWRRDKWKWYAKWILKHSEKQAVKYSDVIIGDNKGITDYVKAEYNKDSVLIPYGGDQVKRIEDNSLYEKYPFCKEDYTCTVCRIEPENNVHLILEAFAKNSRKQLVIVGNWNKSDYGNNLKANFETFKNIHILDPIYDSHTINWIRGNATLYVHGHSAGGTNPSLVEAMNFGLPILAFDCVYNRATTEDKALYWKTAEELTRLMSVSNEKQKEIAKEMLEIGCSYYTWERVSRLYNELY